ncbi:hypothetical protein nbrc107696_39260 [Gordonia spumicola]|uniref:Uncharacterized protein n=1 Tax=Gordonia spumicola TaxID=589161 RepID=A0A7I9VEL7_9ACTN|nr:hypothetical protein [Gordonia spumicola]GEE03480.1 hypothetical protein nbrc107696_39260 [Gordonia spumicola]
MTGSATSQNNDIETCIRGRFDAVALVVEANPTPEEFRAAQSRLGALMREMPSGAHIALLTRHPALILTTLVGHAATRTSDGDFWNGYFDAIGVPADRSFSAAVTAFAGDMLRESGLLDAAELRSDDLVPLLELHAGLPPRDVDALVDVIEAHVAAGRAPSGTAILDHLTEPGFAHRMSVLPNGFRTLLDHAPDIAATFLARICATLVATVASPDDWAGDRLTTATVDLPPTILAALRVRLERAAFLAGDTAAVALCTARFPELRYDVSEGSLTVIVPSDAAATTWRVWAGDAPEQVSVGANEAAVIPVTAALRECVLVSLDTGARRSVPVLLPGDPIVLFAPDGRVMSRHRTLPAGPVVALVPNDAQLLGSGRTPVPITETHAGPWEGWLLRTVDLEGHSTLTVHRDGRPGQTRRVRPVESPSIELPEPLPGITTRDGDPVFGERPLVDLPAHEGDDVKEWRVRVRRAGDVEWLVDYPWAAEDYVTSADPFDGVDGPLLGRYEIAVSDSYRLDLRRVADIAEGLDVVHEPAVRLPVEKGLTESATQFTVGDGLSVDDETVEFAPDVTERITSVSAGDDTLELVVRPPHALVRIERSGVPAAWQTSLAELDVTALDHHRLAVYVPGAVDVSFALLDGDLDIVREWDADGRSGAEFSLATRGVADAAKRLVAGTLVALIDDESGETDEAPIATVVRGGRQASAPSIVVEDPLINEWMRLDAAHAEETGAPPTESPLDAAEAPVDELLTADPTASLLALADSPVSPDRVPAMFIRSGLAELPFTSTGRSGASHPNPYIGCTLAMSAIVDPAAPDRDEVQAYLTTRGGEELLRLLASGRMSDPRTGVFDRNVLAVDAMGRDMVDALFQHFRIVPGPVLDLDMRTSATIDAFHRRVEWMADPVSVEAPRHVNTMLRDVRRSSPEMYDLIAARNEALDGVDTGGNPWMLLSMQSMCFAAVARLQAHGRLKQGGLTDEGRAMWARLADYFPGMVSTDVLIANAVAVRAAALA